MNKTIGKILVGASIIFAGLGLAIKHREPKEVLELEEVEVDIQEENL